MDSDVSSASWSSLVPTGHCGCGYLLDHGKGQLSVWEGQDIDPRVDQTSYLWKCTKVA